MRCRNDAYRRGYNPEESPTFKVEYCTGERQYHTLRRSGQVTGQIGTITQSYQQSRMTVTNFSLYAIL
jgi:hypothetical protein